MHAATSPTLVILAAGRASRYGRLKQLEAIGPHGTALLDYNLFDARAAGFRRFVIVVPEGLEQRFLDHVQDQFASVLDVTCVGQPTSDLPAGRSKPWGTAHALLAVGEHLTSPFAVINGDDAYGRSAFATVASRLRTRMDEACLVAYRLAATLSPHGGVSRGICAVDDTGYLIELTEATDVRRVGDTIVGRAAGDAESVLADDAPTAMNLWGFPPVAVELLRHHWLAFFTSHGESTTAEFLLSTTANDIAQSGDLRFRVLSTDEEWFGLTFPADTPHVRRRVAHRVASGHYPEHLSHGLG
jgi:hypothetical protein